MDERLQLTLLEQCAALHERRWSASELMEIVLARIKETNQDLNAIVALRPAEEVLGDARAADDRIARGEARPLEGIPLGVKDLEHVQGMVTSYGSLLFRDAVANHDEVHVARLRAAGAIPIAKTNAPEFGPTGITKNLLYGVTRSPWNLARTPGGSSGGSAAAIAGCVLPLATASDGGGSIRGPAHCSGLFGLKPSHGRVPVGPVQYWETGQLAVYGPLTKTVEDGAFYLDLVCGASPLDPVSLPHPGISYLEVVRGPAPSALRIGFSPDFGQAVVQSDVAATVEDAARVFEKLGHSLVVVEGGPPPPGDEWFAMAGWDLASRLAEDLPGREDQIMRTNLALVKQAREITPETWGRIHQQRAKICAWVASVFDRVDLLITPTWPYDPVPAKGPWPTETEGRPHDVAIAGTFTMPFNMAWNPAASVRAGLSRAGLPVGMQIAGPQHRDDLVLQAARLFERERPWHPNWPTTWDPLPS